MSWCTRSRRARPSLAAAVEDADGIFVGGGLTPAYHAAFAEIASLVRERVAAGMPYLGFSAGAAIAAERAVIGGYLVDGVVVCDEDVGEELDEVTVVRGPRAGSLLGRRPRGAVGHGVAARRRGGRRTRRVGFRDRRAHRRPMARRREHRSRNGRRAGRRLAGHARRRTCARIRDGASDRSRGVAYRSDSRLSQATSSGVSETFNARETAVQLAGRHRADQGPGGERLIQHPCEGDVDLLAALRCREFRRATLAFEVRIGVPAADEFGIRHAGRGRRAA